MKGSRKASPMLFFWICLLSAVFVIIVCSRLDPLSRIYLSNALSRPSDICRGQRVYMYDLPAEFNTALYDEGQCNQSLIPWMDLCPRFGNGGYGLKLWNESEPQPDGEFDRSSWYDTDSYMLEVIFHKRMQTYHCLTKEPSVADAFFIPYYTGLKSLAPLYDQSPNVKLVHERRKKFGTELLGWLEENGGEAWHRYGGSDHSNHFLIMGRTAWDFKLLKHWGTGFSLLPFIKNMTRLLIEKDNGLEHEQGIPYPTSFHPSSPERLRNWIAGVKSAKRKYLFSYVGAPRPDIWSVRGIIGSSCINAGKSVCKLVNCSVVHCSHDPESIYKAFLQSNFCLQPRGDSATRRSTFDCLISGAIPVFFHNDSAYTQYSWHLPRDPASYSVYIPEEAITKGVSIQDVLMSYSPDRIRKMRKTILSIIPNLLYNDYPNDPLSPRKDAFELSIARVLGKIATVKRNRTIGKRSMRSSRRIVAAAA